MENRTMRGLMGVAVFYAAGAAAAYFFLRWYRGPAFEGFSLSVGLLGLPVAMSLGYLLASRWQFQEAQLILRSVTQPSLEDGKRVVVVGRVEPMGPPLKSPFTGAECVAYEYDIDHEERSVDGPIRRVRDYWGMAVWPYQIRTPAGPVRVLGYAKLEGPAEVLTDDDSYRTAQEYLASTTFRHPASAAERHGSSAEPFSTESDTFGDDICADNRHLHLDRGSGAELRKLQLTERHLKVGETVCAAGTFSAAKQALVPTTDSQRLLRVSTYTPENWAAENRESGRTYIGWSVAFGIFSVGCALATRWC
jgi:hypothetical protein